MANQKTGDTTLTDMRKAAGLTQQQVADAMGVNRLRVGQIEGAFPKVMTPVLLAYMKAIGGRVELVDAGSERVVAEDVIGNPKRASTVAHRERHKDYASLRSVSEA